MYRNKQNQTVRYIIRDANFCPTLSLGKETRIVFIKVTPDLRGVTFAKFSFLKPNLIPFLKVTFPKK